MKALIVTLLLMFVAMPVFAADELHNVVRLKADAPHLIGLPQISDDLYIGAEISKSVASDIFYTTYDWNPDDELLVVLKVTYAGCWINCP